MQVAGERILILGDSLSHHGLDSASPVWDVNVGSARASGAPGDLLASMLLEAGAQAVRVNAKVGRSAISFWSNEPGDQLVASDATWRPSRVIVMLGTNDTGRDLGKTEEAMTRIRDAYRNMGAEVYAIGPMTYVGRGATLNVPAARVYEVMQRVFGASRTIDARPYTTEFLGTRAADGIHFTAQSAAALAQRLLPEVQNIDSLIARMQRRPLVSMGIGFGVVMMIGLIGLAIRRRNHVGGVGYSPIRLDGYRVAYGTSAGLKTYRAFDPNTFPSIDSAIKRFRVYKRQGLWAWVEDEQGNFVPIEGAKKENVRKGYPLRSEDEIKQLTTGHLKPLKGLGIDASLNERQLSALRYAAEKRGFVSAGNGSKWGSMKDLPTLKALAAKGYLRFKAKANIGGGYAYDRYQYEITSEGRDAIK